MVVLDEIPFIKRPHFGILNKVLNTKCDAPSPNSYGNLQMVFTGDFCQLKPPNNFCKPFYTYKDSGLRYKEVNTCLEPKTNHRFKNDVQWGKLLERYRSEGPSKKDIEKINTRVLGEGRYLTEKDLPDNLCYAANTNLDQNAINDAIFKR